MLIDAFTLFGSWPGLPNEHQIEELINGLGRFKVNRACTLSAKGIFFDAAAGNQTTSEVCKEHQNLIPIGVADPRMEGAEQVKFCREQGFGLMALFPASQEWSLASLTAHTVIQHIADSGMPLLIEAGRDGDATAVYEATRDLSLPVILLDVSLRTVTEAVEVLKARPQTYLATRLLCGGDTMEYLINTVGADRLIFTSRFPVSCFSSAFLTAKFAGIPREAQEAILGGNIARLLKLNVGV